jgi:L-asparaginase
LNKPKIAVFSGPTATISNSPPLVTSNKARLPNERKIPGRYDHLVPQFLYEPVKVKIRKFSSHPLEDDASDVYQSDNKEYYEVTLSPEDGSYLLPYAARRADGSKNGVPFEASDLLNRDLDYGTRQTFYPDAQRIFEDIDRTIYGRTEDGEGSILDRKADYDFIRALPSGGYVRRGEKSGVDYFPYKPYPLEKSPRVGDLARVANCVQNTLRHGEYKGAIWLEGSAPLEETLYWLGLMIDTNLPIVGNAAQRPHGQLSSDGARNIVDSVDYILSGKGSGLGAVAIQDQRIFAAREFKKTDARPGNYKATGGSGGILGILTKDGNPTVWYRPNYKFNSSSEVNIARLPNVLEFSDSVDGSKNISIRIKSREGDLLGESIPRITIGKYGSYHQEDETENPEDEVDILARIEKAQRQQTFSDPKVPKLHGLVFEGLTPYASGSMSQMKALSLAALSGMPVVRVGRGDPEGRVITNEKDLYIEGSNLESTKARLLLIASMLKLGRLPKADDPKNPTSRERDAVVAKISEYQKIFETH